MHKNINSRFIKTYGGVDAQSSASFSTIFTLHTSPYKIKKIYSNECGCYFLKYYYSNLLIIYVQSPTNLPKSMRKLVLM
jgi:hypothetical protein